MTQDEKDTHLRACGLSDIEIAETQADGQRIRALTAFRLDTLSVEECNIAVETLALFSACAPLCNACVDRLIGERGWSKQRIRTRVVAGIALLVRSGLAEIPNRNQVKILTPLPHNIAERLLRRNNRIWAYVESAVQKHERN